MRFHELKDAPAGKVFHVWAISPDNQFVKLGQVVSTGKNNEAQIESDVALPDFGLLVTMEDANGAGASPLGPAIGIVEIVR
ncbi:MAG: anti-sigma factor [Acidobacteriota bacterium]